MSALAEKVKAGGGKMTALGWIAIVLGALCMLAPGIAGLSVAFLLGLFVLAAGIVRIIWAFQAGSLGRGVLMFAIGGLTLICGFALMANPLFASGVLTVLLAVYFFLDGISEIAAGIRLRPAPGSGWLLVGGIVSMLLGIMIWRQYPLSGAWAMGILIGIKIFFIGLIMITGGAALRSVAKS